MSGVRGAAIAARIARCLRVFVCFVVEWGCLKESQLCRRGAGGRADGLFLFLRICSCWDLLVDGEYKVRMDEFERGVSVGCFVARE